MGDKITDLKGQPIEGITVSTLRKHQMVKKIFTSKTINQENKKDAFSKLASIDSSDMLERTQKYCEACVPDYEQKRVVWLNMIEMKEDLGVLAIRSYGSGLRQATQLDILDRFADEFFEKIENLVATKGQSASEAVYMFLQPNIKAQDEDIQRYSAFLAKLESQPKLESTERLMKWIKESIQDMKEKKHQKKDNTRE